MSGEYLGEQEYNEIAQWISALDFESKVLGIPGQYLRNPNQYANLTKLYYTQAWNKVASIGYYDQAKGQGSDAFEDILSLRYLVDTKKVSSKEADAYLRLKYPDQKWGSGAWKKKSGSVAAQKAVDKAAKADKSGNTPKPSDIASTAAGKSTEPFTGSAAFGSTTTTPVVLDQFPENYSAEHVGEILESVSSQLSAQIASVASGKGLQLAPGSLSGRVLAPGSIPASALSPIDLEKKLVSAPQPSDAIVLQVARSTSADRWAVDGTTLGPGRIWNVTTARYPAGWKPRAGTARYRIPLADIQFGVMSILMQADAWDGATTYIDSLEVRYGIVLTGIPNVLGRPPMSIRFAQYGEDAPTQMSAVFLDGGFAGNPPWNGTTYLLETRIDDLYRTSSKPAWEAYDLATVDGTLSASDVFNTIKGVSVGLVTASTAVGVWQQLNTRQAYVGRNITGSSHGPIVTCPGGQEMSAPCVPTAIEWDGDASVATTQYQHLNSTTNAAASTRLVQGLPILLDDCSRLTAKQSTFSLVLQVLGYETSNITGTWAKPAHWYEHGVRAPLDQLRDWTLDIVIE